MKERPILFSGPMVRAILEGRKTQTRRVVKPQPEFVWGSGNNGEAHVRYPGGTQPDPWIKCPYGQVGDRLWVRETWGTFERYGIPVDRDLDKLAYRADGGAFVPDMGWKPSIHMPRWASRLTLEIVSVRVERLQDISVGDALAEGIRCPDCGYTARDSGIHLDHAICINKWLQASKAEDVGWHPAIEEFSELWDSINGEGSWNANPWVWVVEFKVVQP